MDRQPLPPPPQQQPPLPPQIVTTPAPPPPPQYQGDPVVYQQYPETTAVAVEQHVPQPPSQYRVNIRIIVLIIGTARLPNVVQSQGITPFRTDQVGVIPDKFKKTHEKRIRMPILCSLLS